MTNTEKRKISVFIASPGDLGKEREQFRIAIQKLNEGFGDGANVEFEALGWEDVYASTGRRNQSLINTQIDKCDVFILVMHKRWGQASPDAGPYSSYTEEEFHRALERWRKEDSPEIFVFFKRVDAASEANPDQQLEKVLQFRKHLEDTRQVLYRSIDENNNTLEDEVDKHLRAYIRGELAQIKLTKETVVFPMLALEEVQQAKKAAAAANLKVEEMQFDAALDAASLAKDGLIERARQKFVKLISTTQNIKILNIAFNFFYGTSDYETTSIVINQMNSLCANDNTSSDASLTFNNNGRLQLDLGNWEIAEELFNKSLTIEKRIGRKLGIAGLYGNLGVLNSKRQKFDSANEMLKKSIAIEREIGESLNLAIDLSNFGNVLREQHNLDEAESAYNESLKLFCKYGSEADTSGVIGNLGIVYEKKEEFERAEAMYQKSIEIAEQYGQKGEVAGLLINLGSLYIQTNRLEDAEKVFLSSLSLMHSIGKTDGKATVCGNLGILYEKMERYEDAIPMYEEAIHYNEKLGRFKSLLPKCFALLALYEKKGENSLVIDLIEKIKKYSY